MTPGKGVIDILHGILGVLGICSIVDVLVRGTDIRIPVVVRRIEHLVVFVMTIAKSVPVAESVFVFFVADGLVADVLGHGVGGPGARGAKSARHQFRLEDAFEGGMDGPEGGVGGGGGF